MDEVRLAEPGNSLPKEEVSVVRDTVFTITKDGVYFFLLTIESKNDFNATVHIEMKGRDGGFLSAVDWPLLPVIKRQMFILLFQLN